MEKQVAFTNQDLIDLRIQALQISYKFDEPFSGTNLTQSKLENAEAIYNFLIFNTK